MASKKDKQPAKVVLQAPYAYYDDANTLHAWNEGQSVEDADQIADLVARDAPLQPINEA